MQCRSITTLPTCLRPGALRPRTFTHWTWTVQRWLGSICGAIPDIRPIGSASNAAPQRPAGGCKVAEDPQLDARQAHPLWTAAADALLHVRAAFTHDSPAGLAFDLWKIPGRKRLTYAGLQLNLKAEQGYNRLRASLSTELQHGTAYGLTVPLDTRLRTRLTGYQVQANVIQGQWPAVAAKKVTRASLLHLHALQALDASQAGAHHRDIAGALFGADAVRTRWTADSELRAQVRHLLTRAEGLMRGGYLALAGVRQQHTSAPGDELAH